MPAIQCGECGQIYHASQAWKVGICPACIMKQAKAAGSNYYWASPPQPVQLYIRDWHSYPETYYISIWGWMQNYESIPRAKALGCFEEVILVSPIIESFDADTFSYLFEYAIRDKSLYPDAAYLIFKELKRRYKLHERLKRFDPPKGIDPRRENR